MKKDCSTCLCREGSCYPSITIFDKDKTCRSYTPDYEGYIADLEESNANLKTEIKEKGRTIHTFQVDIGKLKNENVELKTVKIPQLERRIASIRGAHSVDCKKLNARTEQVERLKKENAGLVAGRPKWHDLRKNPDDLPPRKGLETYSGRVITDKGYSVYNFRKCRWYVDDPDCGFMVHTEVVAWCEIPKYTEE